MNPASLRKGGGILAFFLLSTGQIACAHGLGQVLEGASGQPVTLEAAVAKIPAGSVVVIGENHGVDLHQKQQVALLNALRLNGHVVSVGMEFLSYPSQSLVDRYRRGELSESEFLTQVGWGGTPYSFYREQILFPRLDEGATTIALNAPRALTSRVARVGVSGLTAEETALLPPGFTEGRAGYRRRFSAQMPHLADPSAIDRYFAAQSVWDDTMAWQFAEWRRAHPGQTFVIVVGEFHVRHGGGLPDRILARTGEKPFTFSQVPLLERSANERSEELAADPTDGPRADWIWTDLDPAPTSGNPVP